MSILTLSPGNSLSYDYSPPESGGFTFVFFNALTGDKGVWTAVIGPALQRQGHGLLTYNLRGQAGSGFTFDTADEAAIVADAMALLAHVRPARPIHAGLSIGGLFALKAHLAGGAGAAHGLVLINTLRKAGARLDWINEAVVRAARIGGLALMRDLYVPLLFNRAWLEGNRGDFLGDGPYTPIEDSDGAFILLKSGATADWDVPYEEIGVPVAVVTGLQDRVFFDRDDVDDLCARIPRVERVDMADAGHMVPVERPDGLAQAMLDFAAKLTSGVS